MPLDALIDADAFLFIRKLSILDTMRSTHGIRMRMGEFTGRRELHTIQSTVKELESEGRLTLHVVARRTDADILYRKLKSDGVDKGEAEAIAWAVHHDNADLVFVSGDRRAREAATKQKLVAADVMDLVVLLVEQAGVDADVLRGKLWPWADSEQQLGRPKELTPFDFDEAYAARRPRWV